MLADELDYVVGVETHRDQHAVAIVDAHTGAVIAQTTTAASARGYADAVRFANQHASANRLWAIEGSGHYGAGAGVRLVASGQCAVMRVSAPGLVIAVLGAGCGGGGSSKPSGDPARSNSEALKPSARVVADARAAAMSANSVRVSGRAPSTDGPVEFDFTFAGGKGAKGTIAHDGQVISLGRMGNAIYYRANAAFWRRIGGSRAVALLRGRWVKTSEKNPHFAKLAPLTHINLVLRSRLQDATADGVGKRRREDIPRRTGRRTL